MKTELSRFGPAVLLVSIAVAHGLAEETDADIDAFLSRWEEASRRCQILDTRFTVYCYDTIFREGRPEVYHGRFYFESPAVSRLNLGDSDDVTIWSEQETLLVNPTRLTCLRIPRDALRSHAESTKWTWLRAYLMMLHSPKEVLPLVVDIDAQAVKARYELRTEAQGEHVLVRAFTKRDRDRLLFREIKVLVHSETFRTTAIQLVSPNGYTKRTFVFHSQVTNQRPTDRDELVDLDLERYQVTQWGNE